MAGTNLTTLGVTNGGGSSGNGTVSTIDALMQTVEVSNTLTVTTANAYGTNWCVGGVFTLANAFQGKGSGIVQSVRVTMQHVETSTFTLYLFNANPASSTLTDVTAASIANADCQKVLPPISFNSMSQLGTHTVLSNTGLGMAVALGESNTSLYGVLVTASTLSNNFSNSTEVQVSLTILQDGNS